MPSIAAYRRYITANEGCRASLRWLEDYADPQAAWDDCPNLSWLTWCVATTAGSVADLKRLTIALVACVEKNRSRCRAPIQVTYLRRARMWALGHADMTGFEAREIFLRESTLCSGSDLMYRIATLLDHTRTGVFPPRWARQEWQAIYRSSHSDDLNLFRQFYPAPPAV